MLRGKASSDLLVSTSTDSADRQIGTTAASNVEGR